MKRYQAYNFDSETWIVSDNVENREVCICGHYEGGRDAKRRAGLIAALLNLAEAMARGTRRRPLSKRTVRGL